MNTFYIMIFLYALFFTLIAIIIWSMIKSFNAKNTPPDDLPP